MTSTRRLGPTLAGALGLALACAGSAGAVPAPAGACQLTVAPSSSTWSISGYNPFSSSPLSATYTVTFGNAGTASCDVRVRFRTDGQVYGLAGAGGQSLPYTLLDDTDNANATPFGGMTSNNAQPQLVLKPGAQQIIQYAFVVDLSQLPTDGDFTQHLVVDGVSGVDVLAEKQIDLTLNVAPSAVIGLRGAYVSSGHGGALVDLGELAPGRATTLLQLYVQSTGGYRIDAESANNGQLRLVGAPQWAVGYTMNIGDNSLNLASNAHFSEPRLTTARQDLLPIGFVIGDTAQRRAGAYADVITISVTPQ
jgi:hypothetical protein